MTLANSDALSRQKPTSIEDFERAIDNLASRMSAQESLPTGPAHETQINFLANSAASASITIPVWAKRARVILQAGGASGASGGIAGSGSAVS